MPTPDFAHLLVMAALLLAIGGVAGVIAGLLGVGGGIVLVPAFLYAFTTLGYDGPMIMQVCLATSLATIAATSARSVRGHHAKGAVDWDILRGWAPGIAIGSIVGVVAAIERVVARTAAQVVGACLRGEPAAYRVVARAAKDRVIATTRPIDVAFVSWYGVGGVGGHRRRQPG